jgi:PEP-CTERM motif
MKKMILASLLTLALAGFASASATVTLVGVYNNTTSDITTAEGNFVGALTWQMYALDTSAANDGISYVSFKVSNTLQPNNDVPDDAAYAYNSTTKNGTFGFSSTNEVDPIGTNMYEVISGQAPTALQSGTFDAATANHYPFFLKHVGQHEIDYSYYATKNTKVLTPAAYGTTMTLGGVTGNWLYVADGTLANAGDIPGIVAYAGGNTAGANIVTSGTTTTVGTDASAMFIPAPEPATLTLLAIGGLMGLIRRRRA